MRHASARAAGQERLTGGPWWSNSGLISLSGILPTWAAQLTAVEGGRYMAGGVAKTFAENVTLTRASIGTYSTSAPLLATAAIDVARFDHNPATGVRLGLMSEMERIYFALQSNEFGTSPWLAVRSDLTGTKTTGPDGVSESGWKLLDDGSGGSNNARLQQSVIVATAVKYTFPVFLKKDQLDWASLFAASFTSPGEGSTWFDLANGVLGVVHGDHTARIQEYNNGWYKTSITFTTDAIDTTGTLRLYLSTSNGVITVDLDGTSSIFVFGGGFVLGDYPGSYVDVGASPVTRKADIISLVADGGLPHTGYNTIENTIVGGCTLSDITTEQVIDSYSDGTTDNRVELFVESGSLKARVLVATVAKASITLGTVTAGTAFTYAYSLKANALRGSLNGAAEVNDTAANTIPSVSQCGIFSQLGTTSLVGQGWINYRYQYPSAFSGAELLALT